MTNTLAVAAMLVAPAPAVAAEQLVGAAPLFALATSYRTGTAPYRGKVDLIVSRETKLS